MSRDPEPECSFDDLQQLRRVIEDVEQFCYLGSVITKDGGAEADVNSRINKARNAFHRLNRIWAVRNINIKTKQRIFNTSFRPVLL